MAKGFLWECECGHVEYGVNPPVECKKCSAVSSFISVPDELAEEKEEEHILSSKFEHENEEEN